MERRARRSGLRLSWRRAGRWVVLALIVAYLLFPFYWAINSSLKSEPQLRMTPGTFVPRDPETGALSISFDSYRSVLEDKDFLRSVLNSAIVAGSTTLLALAVGALAGFALGKLRFRGRSSVLYAILSMTMFPQIVILTSLFGIVRTLDLSARWNMVLSYQLFALPLSIWILTAFFRGLPTDLFQAARVDGANPLQMLRYVLVPLGAPAFMTAGVFVFISALNEYLFALTFTIFEQEARTLPIEIAQMSPGAGPNQGSGQVMAAATIVSLPLIALAVLFQRRIVDGLTFGGSRDR